MIRQARSTVVAAFFVSTCLAFPAWAQEQAGSGGDAGTISKPDLEKVHPPKPPYSPYVDRNFPTRPFFGDTHLHTSFSMDAGAFGARLGPNEAYRFAKGEELLSSTDQPVRLSQPLDFLVVGPHLASPPAKEGMGRVEPLNPRTLEPLLHKAKEFGFSDKRIGQLTGLEEAEIRRLRGELSIRPVYKMVTPAQQSSPHIRPICTQRTNGPTIK